MAFQEFRPPCTVETLCMSNSSLQWRDPPGGSYGVCGPYIKGKEVPAGNDYWLFRGSKGPSGKADKTDTKIL